MEITAFCAWQADWPTKLNRHLIRDAAKAKVFRRAIGVVNVV